MELGYFVAIISVLICVIDRRGTVVKKEKRHIIGDI